MNQYRSASVQKTRKYDPIMGKIARMPCGLDPPSGRRHTPGGPGMIPCLVRASYLYAFHCSPSPSAKRTRSSLGCGPLYKISQCARRGEDVHVVGVFSLNAAHGVLTALFVFCFLFPNARALPTSPTLFQFLYFSFVLYLNMRGN